MSDTLQFATVDLLDDIAEEVAGWQRDGVPVQLHPGDLGWQWRSGAQALAAALRAWHRNGRMAAVGMIDGPVIRMAVAPAVEDDEGFADRLVSDLADAGPVPQLPGVNAVEARSGRALQDRLRRAGWLPDEAWTPLSRDLAAPVPDCGLRIDVVDARNVADRVAVERAMFPRSTFTSEQWAVMAAAPPYRRARCLVGYDGAGSAVATVTVWSAGPGRPGLIEPLGVHRDHRGAGYGRAITVAAAAALQELGSSTVTVCTPSDNVAGVAAYVSAGLQRLPEVADFRRPG